MEGGGHPGSARPVPPHTAPRKIGDGLQPRAAARGVRTHRDCRDGGDLGAWPPHAVTEVSRAMGPGDAETETLIEAATRGDASARQAPRERHRRRLRRMFALRLDPRLL